MSARHRACEDECRLNRRLAARTYLNVVPIVRRGCVLRVDGSGAAVEYAVVMRRFDGNRIFAALLEAEALDGETIERTARDIAAFHRSAPRIPPRRLYGSGAWCARQVLAVLADLQNIAPDLVPKTLIEWCEAELGRLDEHFDQRRAQGFVRECHGDLHLQNIALQGSKPLIFDCIDFDPRLRWIDVVSDLAFLVMDLEAHDRDDLATRALNAWLLATGDYAGLKAFRLYSVYRALVRALGETLKTHAVDASRYVRTASRIAFSALPCLLLCHGYSGSGKSSASVGLAQVIGAVRLVSDIERKRTTPFFPPEHGCLPREAYDPQTIDRQYDRLLELTRDVLYGGMTAIVDATFLRRIHRHRFIQLGSELSTPVLILHFDAPDDTLIARVAARAQSQRALSDADPRVLDLQRVQADALTYDEQRITETIHTNVDMKAFDDRAFWHRLLARLHRISHSPIADERLGPG
ncbi:bifunctional aminoglycoside phosphotransferase/ATP-binding protein [Caballeronia grimmiae]|uniref:bifunctional aminoglycoside phosphotransferase/ATP-binding protein n=1 Tax=Caballeronia grimmiae TaxID=1071679 RepID=UPI0038BDD242